MKAGQTKSRNPRIDGSLRKRVNSFDSSLSQGDWNRCDRPVDPKLREGEHPIDLEVDERGLREFVAYHGEVRVPFLESKFHPDVTTRLHTGWEFATVWVVWTDKSPKLREFRWPWVRDGRSWYTRCASLVAPASSDKKRG